MMIVPPVPWPWLNLSWGVFLLLAVSAFLAVAGFSWSVGLALFMLLAVLLAWRFPFASLNLAFCSLLLPGLVIPISTGTIQLGERVFGASIEVTLGEILTVIVVIGWALRILLAREQTARVSARPWLPLGLGFAAIVLAQLASLLSSAAPDPIVVLKYALRPVLFVYLAAVALPSNFLRSWPRLDQTCLAVMLVAAWFALDGARSLVLGSGDAFGIYRAHPLPFWGMNPLGGNHHALAELMVLAAPLALALGERSRHERARICALATAGFFWLIALLTFARAAWLVVALQVALAAVYLWRSWLRVHVRELVALALLTLPLVIYMTVLSFGPFVAQSTSARSVLLDVAWTFFHDHPVVGVGAGTYAERMTRVWAFAVEFGASQDAHGMWQKVAAETGLVGLAALGITLWSLVTMARREWGRLMRHNERAWFVGLCLSALGSLTYQLFSTSLWSARVWLSVGLLCAGMRLMRSPRRQRDPDFLRT